MYLFYIIHSIIRDSKKLISCFMYLHHVSLVCYVLAVCTHVRMENLMPGFKNKKIDVFANFLRHTVTMAHSIFAFFAVLIQFPPFYVCFGSKLKKLCAFF